ncbi:MAG: TonB-dependent receptor [Verrucomicrobia bacterium]|nr:TonB-dependent receptor [Verrucomicrobiota bacterium]
MIKATLNGDKGGAAGRVLLGSAALGWMVAMPIRGAAEEQQLADIEALMGEKVVDSEKSRERLFEVPVSSYLFKEADIQFAPVDSVPELLRYAPGLHVMRATNGVWGIGIRGMNLAYLGRFTFTVDEQNIYSTLYSGIFGSEHDLLMDDIASVEVVYGPGGGLWSTNAMNGMVNVVLKTAFETEGSVVRLSGGNMNRMLSARHGWSLGTQSAARVYFKAGHREASRETAFFEDDWTTLRVGFRMDTRPTRNDLWSISGEAYSSDLGFGRKEFDLRRGGIIEDTTSEKQWGANTQVKWTHQRADGSGFAIRAFTGYTEFDSAFVAFELGVIGLQGSGTFHLSDQHNLVFNISSTVDLERVEGVGNTEFTFDEDTNALSQAGFEHQWDLMRDRVELSWGLTARHETVINETAILPSLRLLYRPTNTTRLWISWARGSRSVPIGMNEVSQLVYRVQKVPVVTVPTPAGPVELEDLVVIAESDGTIRNEKLDAFELGFRQQLGEGVSLGGALFYNRYKDLFGSVSHPGSSGTAPTPVLQAEKPYLLSEVAVANVADGDSVGGEVFLEWKPHSRFQATATYGYLHNRMDPIVDIPSERIDPVSAGFLQNVVDRSAFMLEEGAPKHLATLWIQQRWSDDWQADLTVRFSSHFKNLTSGQEEILQSDGRLTWFARDGLRVSLVGRNLLKAETTEELNGFLGEHSAQPREWYLEVRWEF